jgi:hypothetical protein
MRWVAGFSIFVGLSMLGLWAMLGLTAQIPEWTATPATVITHVTAETLTALCLIFSGIALVRRAVWARSLALVAQGMLIYAAIQASGYYLQSGDYVFVAMFTVIMIAAAASIGWLLSQKGVAG